MLKPLSHNATDAIPRDPEAYQALIHLDDIPDGAICLPDSPGVFFYLMYLPRAKRLAILVSPHTWRVTTFRHLGEGMDRLGLLDDPFAVVGCALSGLANDWMGHSWMSLKITKIVSEHTCITPQRRRLYELV